jgi:hypothetical protein
MKFIFKLIFFSDSISYSLSRKTSIDSLARPTNILKPSINNNNENNNNSSPMNLHYHRRPSTRQSINTIAQQTKQRYGSIDTGNVCDLCKKTKFTNTGSTGHTCFSCKARCCVRCAFKYTTKTKQIWACIECKKKQDAFLKSGRWLNNPALNNNKAYTSDYILNRGTSSSKSPPSLLPTSSTNNQKKDNINEFLKTSNNNNDDEGFTTNVNKPKRKLPVPIKKVLPQPPTTTTSSVTINNNNNTIGSNIPNSGGEDEVTQLKKPQQPKYNTYIQMSDSAQSVPELTRDNESFSNRRSQLFQVN